MCTVYHRYGQEHGCGRGSVQGCKHGHGTRKCMKCRLILGFRHVEK
jgi:hypothetical protein